MRLLIHTDQQPINPVDLFLVRKSRSHVRMGKNHCLKNTDLINKHSDGTSLISR